MDNNEYFASINDVSKRLSVPAHTLRYWEKQFPVAIRPTTGAGGRRYYRAETVTRLTIIKDLLYNRGMTIAGVKKLLRDGNFPSSVDEFMAASISTAPASVNASSASSVSSLDIDLVTSLLTQAREILN